MKYLELNISVEDALQAEIAVAYLADFPFDSFDEQESTLKAYIPAAEYEKCKVELSAMLEQQTFKYEWQEVEQQNWNAEWESGFEAVDVAGERPIRIRAPHHQAPEHGVMDVVIAPRMSFGTGHHATTALMSQSIAELALEGKRGLDMGCGTGVLAIVAVKCGAKQMVAVDIDEWACDSCRDSIALSGVQEHVEVRCGSIESVLECEQFDFVVANINRNILVSMMPRFGELVCKGGELLCSGFLREDVVHIESSARECGFEMVDDVERDGWVVVKCKRV